MNFSAIKIFNCYLDNRVFQKGNMKYLSKEKRVFKNGIKKVANQS